MQNIISLGQKEESIKPVNEHILQKEKEEEKLQKKSRKKNINIQMV